MFLLDQSNSGTGLDSALVHREGVTAAGSVYFFLGPLGPFGPFGVFGVFGGVPPPSH